MSKTLLPSGMPLAQLRHAAEEAIVHGQLITVQAPDLLALLVALDLRERLDPDVRVCAEVTLGWEGSENHMDHPGDDAIAAAKRVLKHEPLPDLSGAPS